MKGPIVTNPKRVPKPDLGGISVELWIGTLRDQVDALRKELDKAKKDIASQQKTIQTLTALVGDLSAKSAARSAAQDSKIAALESKAAKADKHVHSYSFSNVTAFPVHFTDGNGAGQTASFVDAKPDNGKTSTPI